MKAITWAFVPSPTDPKHHGYPHAAFAFIVAVVSTICLSAILASWFEGAYPDLADPLVNSFPAWAESKAVPLLFGYMLLMMATRVKQNGAISLYEMVWACNQAIIMMICGILKKSPIIIGASMVMISIDQCLWYLDIIGFALFRKFPVGVAQYITWPSTTKLRLMTSTHHIWFIPLLIAVLKDTTQLSHPTFFMSFIMTLFQSILGRVLAPRYIKKKGCSDIYMNINLAYELWKDVKIKALSRYDNASGYKAVPFGNLVWNAGNYIFFLLLQLIMHFTRQW